MWTYAQHISGEPSTLIATLNMATCAETRLFANTIPSPYTSKTTTNSRRQCSPRPGSPRASHRPPSGGASFRTAGTRTAAIRICAFVPVSMSVSILCVWAQIYICANEARTKRSKTELPKAVSTPTRVYPYENSKPADAGWRAYITQLQVKVKPDGINTYWADPATVL